MLECLSVRKTRAAALHPYFDDVVEQHMKILKKLLRKVVSAHQTDWYERLPMYLQAYHAFTHETSGMMPTNMVFERELCLPSFHSP